MKYDLNDKYIDTESNKLRRCSQIIKYVHEKILNNQNICRLVYYNTQTPLSKVGLGYDGSKIKQPDLSPNDLKNHIYDIPFTLELKTELQNYIFIQMADNNFDNKSVLYLDINVLVSARYYSISGGHRHYEISQEIANMLDCLSVTEDDYVDSIGNLDFKLINAPEIRVSKTNDMIWISNRYRINLPHFSRVEV